MIDRLRKCDLIFVCIGRNKERNNGLVVAAFMKMVKVDRVAMCLSQIVRLVRLCPDFKLDHVDDVLVDQNSICATSHSRDL